MVAYSLVMNKLKPALKDECTYPAALSFQQTSFTCTPIQITLCPDMSDAELCSWTEGHQRCVWSWPFYSPSLCITAECSTNSTAATFVSWGLQAPALIEWLLRNISDCIQKEASHLRGYKMHQPSSPWQCGHLVVAAFGLWDGWLIVIKQKQTEKFIFTIFCRSKVFPPQYGPHNAGTGSPWEWRGRALEMTETLERTELD